ncbi:MAG: protoporphyrinogen oxidase [Gemmataceae bacterium]
MRPSVVVVGAGISGLSLAYRLRDTADVTVLEASNRPGGCIHTDRADGFTVECGPNGFLDSKPSTLALARDVGLNDQLLAASESSRKNRFLFVHGRLQPLPGGLSALVRSPLLSVRGKLDLLAEPFRTRRHGCGPESVAAFARRRVGREATATLIDALVTGIHGGDPELLDVRAAFPRMTAFEAESGSVVRGMMRAAKQRRAAGLSQQRMWSFAEGLGTLTDALAARTTVRYGVVVRRIEATRDGWLAFDEGGDSWAADALVLACPAYAAAPTVNSFDNELAELLGGIAYNGIAVVALGYRAREVPRNDDGFGYIAPQASRRDLLGVQWCSTIFPGRAPEGCVLWRALCGGWHRPDVVAWPDERLVAAVRHELQLAQGVTAEPIFCRVVRLQRAIPQYLLGHPERVARIETRVAHHPGLFLTGNALHGVAINDCTERAESVAARVTEYLCHRR